MESDAPASQVANSLRDLIADRLRHEYPFMNTESLRRILNNVTSSIEEGIAAGQTTMAESKARISFFSLPVEIRDHIYELALELDPNEKQRARFPRSMDRGWRPGRDLTARYLDLVSSQIQAEARAVFYECNSFVVQTRPYAPTKVSKCLVEETKKWMEIWIKPRAQLFKKIVIQFPDVTPIQLSNFVWLCLHAKENIEDMSPGVLRVGPAPLVTKGMVLSLFSIVEFGVSPSAITVRSDWRGRRTVWKDDGPSNVSCCEYAEWDKIW